MDVERVEARIESLYGGPMRERPGLLHVAAVWAPGDTQWWNLRIGPEAPVSAADRFVLGLARARADAIVTTGAVLRAEPTLSHDYGRDAEESAALAAWREARDFAADAPRVVVLTRGRGLPMSHPLWRAAVPPMIATDASGADALPSELAGVETIVLERPSLASVAAMLRREHGCQTVLIEAGPSTAAALYHAPAAVSELMLSRFCGPALAPGVRGEAFVDPATVRACLPTERAGAPVQEPSGPWRFSRHLGR